jgi:hypothetical protein
MAGFTQDTSPPRRDPGLIPEPHDKHKALFQGMPDTVRATRPGEMYVDPRTGMVTRMLTAEEQREQDRRDRDRQKAAIAQGLESERRCLDTYLEHLTAARATETAARADLDALGPFPKDANHYSQRGRSAIRNRWVTAANAVESLQATINELRAGIVETRKTLKALRAA